MGYTERVQRATFGNKRAEVVAFSTPSDRKDVLMPLDDDDFARMVELWGEDVQAMPRTQAEPSTNTTASAAPPRSTRLSVNLGTAPAQALRELMKRQSITATEAIRRAISVWKFIADEQEAGRRFAVIETKNGKDQVREVVFHLE